jgi:hypothetical protein
MSIGHGITWWAYLHTSGSVQIKRYFSDRDFEDADESPFVARRTGEFAADSWDEAQRRAKELLGLTVEEARGKEKA